MLSWVRDLWVNKRQYVNIQGTPSAITKVKSVCIRSDVLGCLLLTIYSQMIYWTTYSSQRLCTFIC